MKFIKYLTVCLAFGCGAAEDSFDADTKTQELGAPYSDEYAYGVHPTSGRQCNLRNQDQLCTVPAGIGDMWFKAMSYRLETSGFRGNQEEIDEAYAAIEDLDSSLSHWDLYPKVDGPVFAQIVTPTADDNCRGNSLSMEVRAFGCAEVYGTKTLEEGPDVIGRYWSHSGCTIYLDMFQIRWRAAQHDDPRWATLNLIRHALGQGFMTCMGMGWKEGTTHHYSSRYVDLDTARFPVSGQEACMLNWFDSTRNGKFERFPDCP